MSHPILCIGCRYGFHADHVEAHGTGARCPCEGGCERNQPGTIGVEGPPDLEAALANTLARQLLDG